MNTVPNYATNITQIETGRGVNNQLDVTISHPTGGETIMKGNVWQQYYPARYGYALKYLRPAGASVPKIENAIYGEPSILNGGPAITSLKIDGVQWQYQLGTVTNSSLLRLSRASVAVDGAVIERSNKYDEAGYVWSTRNEVGSEYKYEYDVGPEFAGPFLIQEKRLKTVISPVGLEWNLEYDARGNRTRISARSSDGQSLLETYRADFPATCAVKVSCNKPISLTDANGQTTNWTYAPEHGGVLTETGPADSRGVRPQTRFTYVQRQAWIMASNGGYVQTGQPIWLLARKASCKMTAAQGNGCAGGAADEVVTVYDYGPEAGPNNLLLRGIIEDANGEALRTCYGYDWQGNKISETKPQAGLTSCP